MLDSVYIGMAVAMVRMSVYVVVLALSLQDVIVIRVVRLAL